MRRKTVGLRKWLPRHICLVACLLLAAAVFFVACGGSLRERMLATHYEGQLASTNGAETGELLTQLMALGRPGIAAVVRALAAPKPATRGGAYRSLLDELNRCEQQPPGPELGLRLRDLAQALAECVPQVPNVEQARVKSLAMKIVALTEAVPLADRGVVIATCQRILATRPEKQRPTRAVRLHPSPTAAKPQPLVAGKKPPPAHEKPSAQLDLAVFSPPALTRADVQTPLEPGLLRANNAVALAERNEKPRPVEQRPQVKVAAFTPDAGDFQAADEASTVREQAQNLDVIELFKQLRAGQPSASAFRAELDARGFSPRQIEVGEHLVSPDAAERLQWTEWLPGIRGVDARFWLLRLSHDPNGQVRRAAVGLLATDRDPEVVRRLQRVVVEDPDERIRAQASRALEMLGEP